MRSDEGEKLEQFRIVGPHTLLYIAASSIEYCGNVARCVALKLLHAFVVPLTQITPLRSIVAFTD